MKVLIPACNMESRLRNKYLFCWFFLQNWLIFGSFVWGGLLVCTHVCARCGCPWGVLALRGCVFVQPEHVCLNGGVCMHVLVCCEGSMCC